LTQASPGDFFLLVKEDFHMLNEDTDEVEISATNEKTYKNNIKIAAFKYLTELQQSHSTPSGRKVIRYRKRKERKKKKNEFSGHFVCHAARLQRCTGSARTSLGPI
jgi:hypothetical protein